MRVAWTVERPKTLVRVLLKSCLNPSPVPNKSSLRITRMLGKVDSARALSTIAQCEPGVRFRASRRDSGAWFSILPEPRDHFVELSDATQFRGVL